MSSGGGPAIMMMQPAIRATFMPNPPLKFLPPMSETRKKSTKIQKLGGVANFMSNFATGPAPPRPERETRETMIARRAEAQKKQHNAKLEPQITAYREAVDKSQGEYGGMNCYNTIFVGRLAYEVTDRKLLREFESYGPVKDLKLISDSVTGKSKGYGFIEYENEEDMRRAYRAADGMRIEGREIVVDVERGHTVPKWLPRRLGGGLGGTRLGGKMENVRIPGRWDPKQAQQMQHRQQAAHHHNQPRDDYDCLPPDDHHGGYGPPPPGYPNNRGNNNGYGGGGYDRDRGPPRYGGYNNDPNRGGPPPPRGGGGGYDNYRGRPPPPPRGGYGERRPHYDNGPPPQQQQQQWGSRGGGGYGGNNRVGDKRRRSRSGSRERDRGRRW